MPAGESLQGEYPVKPQGGDGIKEGSLDPSEENDDAQEPPGPFQHWYGVENIAKVKINGESCQTLLNNGAQINSITPDYVKNHSLEMGPITDLIGARFACVDLGNAYTHPLGYINVRDRVERVQGYEED